MIVILCNSFQEAVDAYEMFLNFLEYHEPWHIRRNNDYAYFVETDDDIRYQFTEYRYQNIYGENPGVEFIEEDEFFDGLYDFYFCYC